MATTGVLVTGFGGPDSIEAVEPFMCNLMDREPGEELVSRVCARYLAIGGSSPLNEIANSIAGRLEEALDERGNPLPVAVGMRYWKPFIPDAVAGLKELGCDRIMVVSLSPFESKVAHGACMDAVRETADELGGLEIVEAPLVSELPEYADYFAASAAAAIEDVEPNEGAIVIFTAHSLPESDLTDDDSYVSGLRDIADEVATRLGLEKGSEGVGEPALPGISTYGSAAPPRPWFLAFQSKGARPGAWLGPDVDDLVAAAVDNDAIRAVVIVPIGFLTDHMETLYDLDIVTADKVMLADMGYLRAPGPNDDETVVGAIAESVIGLL
jgi:ferrochelatase